MGDVTSAASGGAGLGTPAARWALLAVWALGLLSEVLATGWALPGPWRLLAYSAALCGVIAVTSPGDRMLGRGRTVLAVLASLTTAAAMLASGPALDDLWFYQLAAYLVALLIARGNVIGGTIGCALVIALGLGWAVTVADASSRILDVISLPVMAFAVGIIWRTALQRIVAQERRHRSGAARAELAARLAREAADADVRDLAEIRRDAGALLTGLAAGDPIDAATRREFEVIEAGIRDRLLSPWTLPPRLVSTIAQRRRSGVRVVVLGERTGQRPDIDAALAEALRRLLAETPRGAITIRAVPPGRANAVSVLIDDETEPSRLILLDAHGREVAAPDSPRPAGHHAATSEPPRNRPTIA